MYVADQMKEKDLENRIVEILETKSSSRPVVKTYREGKEFGTLNQLLGKAECGRDYEVLPQKKQKAGGTTGISSTFHGLTPDVIIAGKQSGQDRIVIEVKKYSNPENNDHLDGNQFANYFFHLFSTTDVESPDDINIPRALIVAAPTDWFKVPQNFTVWHHLIRQYGPLAELYKITLAEIHIQDCWN
jgi:hypothetical protein